MFKHRDYPIFSTQKSYWAILFLALLLRLWHVQHFHRINPDECRQLHAAYHITQGKGNVHIEADTLHIEKDVRWIENGWPVGYAATIAGLSYIYPSNFVTYDYILDVCTLLLLLFSMVVFLNILEYEMQSRQLLLLFVGLSFTPIHLLFTTCQLSLAFYLLATAFMLYQQKKTETRIYISAFIGILVYLAIAYRYAYFVLLLTYPIFLVYRFYTYKKNYRLLIQNIGLYILPIGLLYIATIYFFPAESSGGASAYGFLFKPKMYPENLLKTNPFVFYNLFYVSAILTRLSSNALSILTNLIGAILSIYVIFGFFKKAYAYMVENSPLAQAYILGTSTFALTVGMLLAMGLFIAPMPVVGIYQDYTFVQETRYYAPVFFFLLLFIFEKAKESLFYKLLITAAFLYSFVFYAYLFYQIEIKKNLYFTGTYHFYHGDLAENLAELKRQKAAFPLERWVCTTPDDLTEKIYTTIGITSFEGSIQLYLQHNSLPPNVRLLLSQEELKLLPSSLFISYQKDTLCQGRYILFGKPRPK